MHIDIEEARTHFSELIERTHAGETIIISRHGKPEVILVPYTEAAKSRQSGDICDVGRLPKRSGMDAMAEPSQT